jgi:methyl-accepting chemotaxis protein
MAFRDWKVGTRLGAGFATVILLLVGVTILADNRMAILNSGTDLIVRGRYGTGKITAEVQKGILESAVSQRNLLFIDNPSRSAEELRLLSQTQNRIDENVNALERRLTTEKGRELFRGLQAAKAKYDVVRKDYLRLLSIGERQAAGSLLLSSLHKEQEAYLSYIGYMNDFGSKLMEKDAADADVAYRDAKRIMWLMTVLAGLFACAFGWWITRSITRPLNQAVTIARTVASGNLTCSIIPDAKDETGQLIEALGHMNEGLRKLVSEVRTGTETLMTATKEIATGNQDLSSRTEHQAGSLEEIASAMEELTSAVKHNADNSRQANEMADAASEVARRSGEVVAQVIQTMGSINAASKKIADIIGVIDDIAFQTNLLALNAAVEAARAGEQGRGFAVVASEVRSLAKRSAEAAKEIKTLIADSVNQVDTGNRLVDEAGNTMIEVVTSVNRVGCIISEITAASKDQSARIESVNQAIGEMDQMTQQNAALVEQAAAAAESMQDQTMTLERIVATFKIHNASLSESVSAAPLQRNVAPLHVRVRQPIPSTRNLTLREATLINGTPIPRGRNGDHWEEF